MGSPQNSSRMEIDGDEERKKSNPIVVILVGAPGSGKSTFCDHVIRVSSRPWVRICQDTIGKGKAGTKTQCLMSAITALKDSKSIFIDRCNLDREQRADFVKLGRSHQVDVHAVVLDLPARLCISRSVKRTGHEGNLQGGKAAAVVNRMLQKKELPKLNEGFTRITFCQNESDVDAAMNTYAGLLPLDVLPSGCFGEKKPDAKVQLGIMKFLKKVDSPSNPASVADQLIKEKYLVDKGPEGSVSISQLSVADQISKEKYHVDKEPEGSISMEIKDGEELELGPLDDTIPSDSVPTLAFPSLSTADFQFNLEKASEIIVEKVEEFLNSLGNARLVLVDLSHASKILSLVRTKAAKKNIDPSKFFTFVGDITQLHSKGGLQCNVIANAANWRLKAGGGGVNAAIFSAAGPDLDIATKKRAGSLTPGKAVIVPLPSTSPLFSRERVTHVIHVLGPNMNPQRPNCLNNDYINGCKILREAYSSLFDSFASVVKSQDKLSNPSSEKLKFGVSKLEDHQELRQVNQSSNCYQKIKRKNAHESENNKKSKAFTIEDGYKGTNSMDQKNNPNSEKISRSMNRSWGSWAQALHQVAMNPEKHKDDVLVESDEVIVLNDAYPKAQKHLLVLARADGLDSLSDVRKEHLQLLRTMHAMGLNWAEKLSTENESLVFRLGYHSAPSMRQLHLHVISQDFDSKHLKNKKHWNSFNTPFFRDSVDVIEEVSEHGKASLRVDDNFMSKELRCHRCQSAHPNIPRLKSHFTICRAPFPASLLQDGRLVFAPSKAVSR